MIFCYRRIGKLGRIFGIRSYTTFYPFLALLVRLQVTEKSKTHGRKITQLSKTAHALHKQSEILEAAGDHEGASKLHDEAQEKTKEVMGKLLNA